MNIKPWRTLQTALGLSCNAVDGRYGPCSLALVQTTLQGINPVTPTDGHSWRGGSTTSTHACGSAFDPDRNPLKLGKNSARLAQPEYAAVTTTGCICRRYGCERKPGIFLFSFISRFLNCFALLIENHL